MVGEPFFEGRNVPYVELGFQTREYYLPSNWFYWLVKILPTGHLPYPKHFWTWNYWIPYYWNLDGCVSVSFPWGCVLEIHWINPVTKICLSENTDANQPRSTWGRADVVPMGQTQLYKSLKLKANSEIFYLTFDLEILHMRKMFNRFVWIYCYLYLN